MEKGGESTFNSLGTHIGPQVVNADIDLVGALGDACINLIETLINLVKALVYVRTNIRDVRTNIRDICTNIREGVEDLVAAGDGGDVLEFSQLCTDDGGIRLFHSCV